MLPKIAHLRPDSRDTKGAVIGGTASGVVNVGAQYAKEGDISKVDWWETLVSTVTGYGTAYSSIPKLMLVNGASTTALKYAEGEEHFIAEGASSPCLVT